MSKPSAAIMLLCSTHVEVTLKFHVNVAFWNTLLHTCGGDSGHVIFAFFLKFFSPRKWGWLYTLNDFIRDACLFSTKVEVFRTTDAVVLFFAF